MNLEEAVKILQKTVKSNNEVIKEARKNGDINVMQLTADLDNQSIAIETALKELKNSIPKKRVEDKINLLENLQEEFPDNEEIRTKIIVLKELLEEN